MVFHFDFKDAEGKKVITDKNGKIKCFSKNGPFVIQERALRIAPLADIYIPGEQLPVLKKEMTVSLWVVKGFFGYVDPLLFKGVHAFPLQFVFSLAGRSPVFCYKIPSQRNCWQGIFEVSFSTSWKASYADKSWVIPGKKNTVEAGYWNNIAATFKDGKIEIFLNGELILSKKAGPLLEPNNLPLHIGTEKLFGKKENLRTANILINDIRLYSKALSADKIKNIYESEKNKYPAKSVFAKGEILLPECHDYIKAVIPEYDPHFTNKLKITKEYEKNPPPAVALPKKNMVSAIKPVDGHIGLFINNRENYPFFVFAGTTEWNNRYRLKGIFPEIRDFAAAGVNLINITAVPSISWTNEGTYAFDKVDEIVRTALKANPKGELLISFLIRPGSWFFSRYRKELERYYPTHDSRNALKIHYSCAPLGSKVWIQCSAQMAGDFAKHIESQDYAGRIIGYHVFCGDAGEWYWPASFGGGIPGYSEATRNNFRQWLKDKYKNNKNLQQAWSNMSVTCETAQVPDVEYRLSTENNIFRDPDKARPVIDFREFMGDITYQGIVRVCKAIKESSNYKKIVSLYSGYSLLYAGKQITAHIGGLQVLGRVFRSPFVDMIGTPLDYVNRRDGETGANINAFNGSAFLHKKLLVNENDLRTYMTPKNEFGRTKSLRATSEVMKRGFGHSLILGSAFWFCAVFFADNEGVAMFHQEDLMRTVAEIEKLAQNAVGENRSSLAEAAIIFDEKSTLYTSVPKGNFIDKHTWGVYQNAFRMGTPFDCFLLDDMNNPDMRDYKLYIILNAYRLNEKQRQMISAKVRRNNSTVVWCYAPGYLSEKGFSTETMRDLTGINLKENRGEAVLRLDIVDHSSPITRYVGKQKFNDYKFGPVFSVDDKDAKILGLVAGKPALAVKKFKKWRSVYSLMPLTKELLMGLADYAGVHVYSRDFDVFNANRSFLLLHMSGDGKRTIVLPEKRDVKECFSGRVIGKNIKMFTEQNLKKGDTLIYQVSKPNTKN
jgi:hypothetical protein